MSLRPTPAKFNDCGRRNGGRTGTPGVRGGGLAAGAFAAGAFGAAVFGALLDAAFFLAIAGNPTRRRPILNVTRSGVCFAWKGPVCGRQIKAASRSLAPD